MVFVLFVSFDIHTTINYSTMFDTEYSDSDVDEKTLAWINGHP